MAKRQSWRKAYGALKDSTTVSLVNLNSDFKELDVSIVKATNHVECPPKERHIRKILAASGISRPRADVAYCIRALARRLAKTHNWTVALKTLIVIHRSLREGDPTFREELLNFSQRAGILQLSNFKDDSSPIAWDCSAWVRTYSLFLEERLECFRLLKYDIETERLFKPTEVSVKGGGFDKLTLHSLYDEATYRQQQQQQYYDVSAPNPFMAADPFAVSNQIATPPSVQMAAMAHQQSPITQSNPFMQPMPLQQQHPIFAGAEANPFTDTTGFGTFSVNNTHHQSNPFGSTQLL